VLVLLGALALHRTPIRLGQAVGVGVTLAGVALVASHGHLSALLALRFNLGDVFMLVACGFYAAYTLALRGRTGVSGFAFFAGLAAAAFATTVPLMAAEALAGAAVWPTLAGWAILAFVALGPSFVAQIFYMRAVELIGPGRAGLFINLVPVFGALMAVALLGEPFGWHSGLALLLVFGGILLAETSVRAPRA
jgi:drug/metabolite transporter (DMT)-like permease